jgi:PhnB protein
VDVRPYLFFDGRCDEAIAFYRESVGAEVQMLMRFKDHPEPQGQAAIPPGGGEKVMHAELRIGETVIFVSDGRCLGQPSFQGFGLALTARDDAEAAKVFAALGKDGKVTMPLAKTFFSSSFGMLADRFGITWMVLVRA